MKLTAVQIAQVAYSAGFRGDGLTKAVAVALAESGGNTTAVGTNTDSRRSRDRGLWQINDYWHKEVTDAQAFDPNGAASATFRISSGGKNWSPWSTYKNGSAAAQYGTARLAAAKVAGGTGAVVPAGKPPKAGGKAGTTATQTGLDDYLLPGGLGGLPIGPGIPGIFGPLGPEALTNGQTSTLDVLKSGLAMAIHAGVWMSNAHNWARVAMVGGGTIGVLIGVSLLAKSGAAGSTAAGVAAIPGKAAKTAANVVPIGKVATVAKAAATAGK